MNAVSTLHFLRLKLYLQCKKTAVNSSKDKLTAAINFYIQTTCPTIPSAEHLRTRAKNHPAMQNKYWQ